MKARTHENRDSKTAPVELLPDVLTASQAARLLQVSKVGLYRLAKKRGFPVKHVGAMLRFSRKRLIEWVEAA